MPEVGAPYFIAIYGHSPFGFAEAAPAARPSVSALSVRVGDGDAVCPQPIRKIVGN